MMLEVTLLEEGVMFAGASAGVLAGVLVRALVGVNMKLGGGMRAG